MCTTSISTYPTLCFSFGYILLSPWFLQNVFVKFDHPHKGRTSSFNLRPLLWEAGITVSNKVLECLVIRYAKDCTITAEAFIGALVKLYLAHDRYGQVEKKLKENTISLEEMILMTVYS
ncbi:unnamed protein product [Ixodes pacificus]